MLPETIKIFRHVGHKKTDFYMAHHLLVYVKSSARISIGITRKRKLLMASLVHGRREVLAPFGRDSSDPAPSLCLHCSWNCWSSKN